ncbi:protein transport protein sec24A, putative [Leishmania tarentolae]|uniref:Protein transport protein sec24A, putative n=1 Tax=Leishmania tarentolae TaxID=5689 RepID=A0A640KLQ8_LEITA|nr:protein transport protein sec24A, putative [Leishmania tarentolae]
MMYSAGAMYAEIYRNQSVAAATKPREEPTPPPNLRHTFEDPNQFYTAPASGYGQQPPVQPSPHQPQQQGTPAAYPPMGGSVPYSQQPANPAYVSPYSQANPYGNVYEASPPPPQGYPSYAPAAPPQHQQPQQPQPQQQYNMPPQAPQQHYGNYTQSPGAYGHQPPMQQSPQQQPYSTPSYPQQPNPDFIRVTQVQLRKSSNKPGALYDHPSIPRMMPQDIEEDLQQRMPAPVHITPTSRLCIRPTMSTFPQTQQLADSLSLPIGINFRPFAEPRLNEVDLSDKGNAMIRCKVCGAYINPFTTFTEVNDSSKWQCILCKNINATPRAYYSRIDPQTGQLEDIMNRPELLHCSVDFYATPEFLKRPPRRPVFLLMLDCSFSAVASGLLDAMCRGALTALDSMKDDDALYMGIMGYDSTVYFFNLRSSLRAPRMMASPDTVRDIANVNDDFKLDKVELPCPTSDLVVSVKESYHLLRKALESIPIVFASTKEVGCAFGPSLAAAVTMLDANGGKILASITSIPSEGDGKLKHRFDPAKLSNQPKEYTMCVAANDWYKQRALVCSNSAISVDLFVGSNKDVDLTTIAPLARFTSGSIHRATSVTMSGMAYQVQRSLLRFTAFDCTLRVRTSKGLIVPNFYGHCHVRVPDLLVLPIADEDSSYSIEFKMGPNYAAKFAYVQFAVVYTTRSRERRIRVHTIQLPVSSIIGPVINSISSLGMSCFLSKMCVDMALNGPFQQAQEKITEKLTTAWRTALKQIEAQGVRPSTGELLIPESMRFIPQLLCGFFRCAATGLATVRPLPPDERVASMSSVMSCTIEAMVPWYVTWTYVVYAPEEDVSRLPSPIFSSEQCVHREGVYLINVGAVIVLWFGKQVHPTICQLFGVDPGEMTQEKAEKQGQLNVSPEQLEALRQRVEELIWVHRQINRSAFTAVMEPCAQGNATYEPMMKRGMGEDNTRNLISYGSYLRKAWDTVIAGK